MSFGTGNVTRWTNIIPGYTTQATSGGTTTLTAASNRVQVFTGTLGHTVTLPNIVAGTWGGLQFEFHNQSTGIVLIQNSAAVAQMNLRPLTSAIFTASPTEWNTIFQPCFDANVTTSFPAPTDLTKGCWFGTNTKANAFDSTCITIGQNASTGATNAIAIGISTGATAANAIAFGSSASATASPSIAIGLSASCAGVGSMAIGASSSASSGATNSVCIGATATSTGIDSVCIGNVTTNNNGDARSICIGSASTIGVTGAAGADCIALGSKIKIGVNATGSVAIGTGISVGTAGVTSNVGCVAIGSLCKVNTSAGGTNDHVVLIGTSSTCANNCTEAIAIGNTATVNVSRGVAIGNAATANTVASGGSGLAVVIPTDSKVSGAPGATTNTLILVINGSRYKVALTSF